MIGKDYYFTGINLQYGYAGGSKNGWSATLDFHDGGFANDNVAAGIVSTEGTIRTRYPLRDENGVSGVQVALQSILQDAGRLGISEISTLHSDGLKTVIFVSVFNKNEAPFYEDVPASDLALIAALAKDLDFEVIYNER
jgi:hypothetical protein